MILARHNDQLLVSDFIDEAMFAGDAARPITSKLLFKRLGFADALKWCSCRLDDDAPNAVKQFLVGSGQSL